MINEFRGVYRFLSNFWYFSSGIMYDNILYPTVEHFFQAMKTLVREERIAIANAPTPGIAKKMGSPDGYKGFKIVLRADWENIKIRVMAYALRKKFEDFNLKQKLIETYPRRLVEGNTWHDNTWGACTCQRCRHKPKQNLLGQLLEVLRIHLINGTLPADPDPVF